MTAHDSLSMTLESGDFSCERLRVRAFSGTEAIGRLFDYSLEVVCLDAQGPAIEAMMGGRVTLVIERSEEAGAGWHGTRHLHGMIVAIDDLLAAHADRRVYRLRVVPGAFALTLVETQDIFMGLSIPQIVNLKLAAMNLAERASMRVTGQYAAREFVVQYKETDLAFISRLLEHVGVSFFFVHGEATETMVFTDYEGGFPRIEDGPPIAFRDDGLERDVFALEAKHRMIPSYYVVHDYNYRAPLVDITGSYELPTGFAGGVIEYGSHHKTPDEAQHLARIRAEERQATQLVYCGRSAVPSFAAGARFTLEDAPTPESGELVITSVEHRASQEVLGVPGSGGPSYTNTFSAIPASRMYRPARVTPKPRIPGLVTGIIAAGISGGNTRYAELDAEGRYTVRFLFDTTPEGERAASRPVRMAQNHVGEGYGTHFPLKPGVEVVIGFIEGDPDRPVILGAVPDALHRSPVDNQNPGIHRIMTSSGIKVDMHE